MRLFDRPWLAPTLACFSDFFGLNCTVPTLPIFLLAWGSTRLATREDAVVWARFWTGCILTTQSVAKIPGHLLWGIQSGRVGGKPVLQLVLVLNALAFAASAIFAAHGLPSRAVIGLLVVRLFAGVSAPIVPAFVFLFERQEPGPALVASVGKIGGGILSGLTLGAAAVAIPFGEPAANWAGISLLSAAIALLVLIPVHLSPPILEHVVATRRKPPEGVRRALLTNEVRSPNCLHHLSPARSHACVLLAAPTC